MIQPLVSALALNRTKAMLAARMFATESYKLVQSSIREVSIGPVSLPLYFRHVHTDVAWSLLPPVSCAHAPVALGSYEIDPARYAHQRELARPTRARLLPWPPRLTNGTYRARPSPKHMRVGREGAAFGWNHSLLVCAR